MLCSTNALDCGLSIDCFSINRLQQVSVTSVSMEIEKRVLFCSGPKVYILPGFQANCGSVFGTVFPLCFVFFCVLLSSVKAMNLSQIATDTYM